MGFRATASLGQLSELNYDTLHQKGESWTNRLSYWMVTGKRTWEGMYPDDTHPNSCAQVFRDIVQLNKDAKDAIEALRSSAASAASGALAIAPSAPQAISVAAQTIGAGFFDTPVAQERNQPISPVRALLLGANAGVVPTAGRRLEDINPPAVQATEIPLITTKDIRIVELWCLITKAQQLPYSDQSRTEMLMQALVKYVQIIGSGHLNLYDFDTLQDNLMPTLLKELGDLSLAAAASDPTARLAGAQTLNVGHLTNTQFTWDVNFSPRGAPQGVGNAALELMDIRKFVSTNQNTDGTVTKSVVLDSQHAQYIASNANEFITIGSDPFATGPTNYNVAGMAGNDIFSISADALGQNSNINLIGGGGKNTYLIYGKGSWSQLASTIHIWDFDSSKDTIVLLTSDGAISLNETKRTLFRSAYTKEQWNSEQVLLRQTNAKMNSYSALVANFFKSAGDFKAAEHVFTGEGMPVIVVDEQNYSTSNPDSIFSALKTSQRSNLNGQLPLSEAVSTTFGKLNTNVEHQQYTVHLTAGKSYVFTMSHSPYEVGDAVLVTKLTLKDAQNTAVAIGREVNHGDSRIDYLALKDGDFILDASSGGVSPNVGEVPSDMGNPSGICINPVSLSSYEGKYAISTVEIPHTNIELGYGDGAMAKVVGDFDGISNHVGYKISLQAGEYVNMDIMLVNGRSEYPELSIFNNDGKVNTYDGVTNNLARQTFLVQKTGDYFIEATLNAPAPLNGKTQFELYTRLKDIEGSKLTMANLSVNSLITSNLYDKKDHDWFKVSLDANKKYQFDLRKDDLRKESPGQYLDTFLRLRDNNGNQLAYDDDSGGNYNSRLLYTPSASGNYYIDAASWYEGSSGAYTLSYKVI